MVSGRYKEYRKNKFKDMRKENKNNCIVPVVEGRRMFGLLIWGRILPLFFFKKKKMVSNGIDTM